MLSGFKPGYFLSMLKRKNLFPVNKIPYLKNRAYREKNCILCRILENSPEVTNLLIYRGETASVSLNLYPYNPGHLMIFPHRHLTDFRKLTKTEDLEISLLTRAGMDLLESLYEAKGFNVGYNMGENSGASIEHLHLHLVPRYPNETGFLDILSGVKLIVENPEETRMRLLSAMPDFVTRRKKEEG